MTLLLPLFRLRETPENQICQLAELNPLGINTLQPSILQTDPAWLPSRRGSLTCSRYNDAIDYLKGGKESAARRGYKIELVGERMTDWAVSRYVTPAMQRGRDEEPNARMAYEARTGFICGPAALIHHPRIEHFCGTPDAFVGAHGLAQFKVPLLTTYISWVEGGVIPEEHKHQLVAELTVTGRKWNDFVAYAPEMPDGRNLFIRRFVPSQEDIANCEAGAVQFLDEVDRLFFAITHAEFSA